MRQCEILVDGDPVIAGNGALGVVKRVDLIRGSVAENIGVTSLVGFAEAARRQTRRHVSADGARRQVQKGLVADDARRQIQKGLVADDARRQVRSRGFADDARRRSRRRESVVITTKVLNFTHRRRLIRAYVVLQLVLAVEGNDIWTRIIGCSSVVRGFFPIWLVGSNVKSPVVRIRFGIAFKVIAVIET